MPNLDFRYCVDAALCPETGEYVVGEELKSKVRYILRDAMRRKYCPPGRGPASVRLTPRVQRLTSVEQTDINSIVCMLTTSMLTSRSHNATTRSSSPRWRRMMSPKFGRSG